MDMASSNLWWLGNGLVVGDHHQSGEMFNLSVAASNDIIRRVDHLVFYCTIELKYKSNHLHHDLQGKRRYKRFAVSSTRSSVTSSSLLHSLHDKLQLHQNTCKIRKHTSTLHNQTTVSHGLGTNIRNTLALRP
jgi:hypothetical protein